MKRMLLICGLAAAMLGPAAVSVGQGVASLSNEQKDDGPKVTRMIVHPAAEPRPALKYKLLPGFLERRPGDAAVIYNRMWAEKYSCHEEIVENWQDYYSWIDMPLDKLPLERVEQFVGMTGSIYRDFRWAARLDSCDWSLPTREGNPVVILLPDIQEKREAARMFAVRVRFQIARGQFDEAVETLRTGYALGRNMGKGDFIVSHLVGMAICGMMSDQIETMVQQPGCPNLYWALTNLPRPLVDMRRAFETEYDLLYLAYPELLHVDDPVGGAEYARLWIERMIREPACWHEKMWDAPNAEQQLELRAVLTGMVLRGYPMAKRALVAQGRSLEEVEAMPVTQVVAIHTVRTFSELRDDEFKWFSLPWWQAESGMKKADRRLREEGRRRKIIPLAQMLLPALQAAKHAEARVERKIALLRMIEALRLYAASHDGHLPAKISDLTEVPIPIDPYTGKPIECRIEGDVATLVDWHYGPSNPTPDDRLIEIRIAK